jgi:2-methylthioadenine synthetase
MLEYDKLKYYITENKFNIVSDIYNADVIIFFACGMKEDASLNLIEELSKKSKEIILFGCANDMLFLEKYDNIHRVGLYDYEKLDLLLESEKTYSILNNNNNIYFNDKKFNYEQAMSMWDPRLFLPKSSNVYPIQISTGCSNDCSYCSIHFATGKLLSRPVEEIVKEVTEMNRLGYIYFRMQCENSGSYGTDSGESISELLSKISKINKNIKIDLPDMHPRGFLDNFNAILEAIKNETIYLLHIPIQSGSNKVLEKMNRNYDINLVLEKLQIVRERSSKLIIGTDIIVGFPGETDDDFYQTVNILSEFDFSPIYIHGYRNQKGTRASEFDNKISDKLIEDRIKLLYKKFPHAACYLNEYRERDNI